MRPSTYNKHEELVDKTFNFTPEKSYMQQFHEYLWGKDYATIRFERELEIYQQKLFA
jgi:hypothetical protein